MPKLNNHDVGALVCRFQVEKLHEAHKKLIEEVISRHNNRVIIFIGVSPTMGTKENPLDFITRKSMVESAFPGIVVLPLMDCSRDEVWSKNLDTQIRTVYPLGKVCLYGGRDSFLKSYCGQFDAHEFPTHDYRPGYEVREAIGKESINSEDFRSGVIYSTQNQYKRTYLTIDVAVYRKFPQKAGDKRKPEIEILMGRKHNEIGYRFIGGFVEGESLEETVRREAAEEAHVTLEGGIEFVGSFVVRDWRYNNTSDSVLTSFFASELSWGGAITGKDEEKAGDDLEEIKWINLKHLYNSSKDIVVDNHQVLVEKLAEYFNIVKKGKEDNE